MKIWFTEIGEPLPLEKDSRLHRYGLLTRTLASLGHEVTWWTSNFSHAQKTFVIPGDGEETVQGVKLKVLAGPGYGRNISLKRFRHQAHFAKRFAEAARKAPKPDLLISPIPTLETATEAYRYGKEAGVPVLTDIRDEWPAEFVRLAPGPARWAVRLALHPLFRRAHAICQNVDGILGISERQLQYGLDLAKRGQQANDGIFPLGYFEERPDPAKVEAAHAWWREQGLTDEFLRDATVVCFFGTIGKFFDLETVIRAADRINQTAKVKFVLCGDGSELTRFKKLAANNSAVLFPGWVDSPKIAALMELSHIGLAPYRHDAEAISLPNKPFEYFSGGLPVVSSIEGELKAIIAQANCGLSYRGNSVEELTTAILDLAAHPEKRAAMGANARKLLETQFSTKVIHRRLEAHLHQVVERFNSARNG